MTRMQTADLIHQEDPAGPLELDRSRRVEGLLLSGVALVVGALAGFLTIRVHPLSALALIGVVVGLFLILRRPWTGVPALLALTCFIPFHSAIPYTNVGSIHFPDLLLAALFALALREKILRGQPLYGSSLSWAVFAFCGVGFVAVVLGRIRYGTLFFEALLEYKVVAYYLLAWLLPNLVRDAKTFRRCVFACLALSSLVVLPLAVRAVLHPISSDLSAGEIYYAMQDRAGGSGTILVYWGFCTALSLLLFERFRWAFVVVCATSLVFFALMFQRHMYIAIGLCLMIYGLLALRFRFERFLQMLGVGLVGLLLFFVAAYWGPESLSRYARLTVQRLVSITEEDAAESLSYREMENHYAWKTILKDPATGIGFSKSYRPPLYESEKYGGPSLDCFLHHAYLWMLLKMGLLGLLAFLAMVVLFFKRSIHLLRAPVPAFARVVVLGGVCAFPGLLVVNLVAPYFMQDWGTAAVGMIMGFTESARRIWTQPAEIRAYSMTDARQDNGAEEAAP